MKHELRSIGAALVLAYAALWLQGCAGPGWPMFSPPPKCSQPLPPVIEVPTPVASGYLQAGPAVHGQLSGPPNQPTATDRVIELSDRLVTLNSEVVQLKQRIGGLELELVQRDKSIAAAAEEIQITRTQLEQYRLRFQEWEAEAKRLEAHIERSNRRHGEAIKSLTERLTEMIQTYAADAAASTPAEPNATPTLELSNLFDLGRNK